MAKPSFTLLDGLPVYGAPAVPFPTEWGRLGREGTVVEIQPRSAPPWTANVRRGLGGVTDAFCHPDGHHVVVVSHGDLWSIDPETRQGSELSAVVERLWPVEGVAAYIGSRQGLALFRLGEAGIVWHTRRLSWDGFEDVVVQSRRITGQAWDVTRDLWRPFEVDLQTGRSIGGAFEFEDEDGWEQLAPAPDAA